MNYELEEDDQDDYYDNVVEPVLAELELQAVETYQINSDE